MSRIVFPVAIALSLGAITAMDRAATVTTRPAVVDAAVSHIDPRQEGVHHAGRWQYQVRIEQIQPPPGATWSAQTRKAQWRWGELLFGGKPLSHPKLYDATITPWGLMAWEGKPGEDGTQPEGSGWGLLPFTLLSEPAPDPKQVEASEGTPRTLDTSRSAVYRVGRWEYRTHIRHDQLHQRGGIGNVNVEVRWGELLFNGKPVEARLQEYVETPWGLMLWEGERPIATDTGIRGPGWVLLPFRLLLAAPAVD